MGNQPSRSGGHNNMRLSSSANKGSSGGKRTSATSVGSDTNRSDSSSRDRSPSESKTTAKQILKAWCPPEGDGVPGEATRLAKAWVKAKNDRDMMTLYRLAHEDACYRLPAEGICIPMRQFIDVIFELADAFPDLTYKFADAAEPRSGVAILYEYYATGTHTGQSYSFQGKRSIPITKEKVLDGPVVKTITIKNGKIIDFLVYAPLGNTVGPLAFYKATKEAHSFSQVVLSQLQ